MCVCMGTSLQLRRKSRLCGGDVVVVVGDGGEGDGGRVGRCGGRVRRTRSMREGFRGCLDVVVSLSMRPRA